MAPLGIAILGGGIFVQEAHLPALQELGTSAARILAIYSRSKASAEASVEVCSNFGLGTPAVYHDGDASSDLAALLKRPDIKAVIVALPITKQGEVVLQCLEAGKHVLSEKPVGRDVKEGIELIKQYEKVYKPKGLIWRIAENWEVEPTFLWVKQALASGAIGKVQTFSLISINYVSPVGNKWYNTPWRTKPDYQGGFLLDGGVHSAAFLRTVLPSPLVSLSGFAVLLNEHLAPHDCIHATLKCADGAQGFFNLNSGASGWEGGGGTTILGTDGSVEVQHFSKEGKPWIRAVLRRGKKGEQKEEVYEHPSSGVLEEQRYFVEAVEGKTDNDYGNPRGAVEDVAVIQAGLTSEGTKIEFSQLIPKF
ncbi:NAD(P)-binding protein [Calocera viscosa TUFC12733]|uniref:NAD(P)-binding protein n=1 Tax=Calocera viscosa (strain TUFC12733) TaxID=1330018 RepID=A0A167KKI3_CALVF|nr:NAD(P)-binding protein [Calocera viscosa TUFC12733]